MPQPFLDFGNVGAVLERVGCRGGSHGMGSKEGQGGETECLAVMLDHVGIDTLGAETAVSAGIAQRAK